MGDRTNVTLTVLTAQADSAREVFDYDAGEEWMSDCGNYTTFAWEEVNYADLEFESELTKAGIAWSKRWDAGGEYTAGAECVRFRPNGTVQHIEVYDEDANPPLDKLLSLCDKPDELVAYIRQFELDTTPLPWDNQIEYGQIYTTNREK